MNRVRAGAAALAITAAWVAAPLAGQGSSVYTQSACVSARGGAAVAGPCLDASSIYYNPAALAMLPSAVSVGLTAIYNTGSFTYDSSGVEVEREAGVPLVPHAYASYRFGERWAAGLGFFAPYGLRIEWPEDFEGRFISRESAHQGLYFQPTLAFEAVPGVLAVGAGVDVVRGGIEINQHVDAPIENPLLAVLGVPLGTDIARGRLAGDGWGVGAHVGVYWTPGERLALGARYMHEVEVDLDGDADFEQIATGRTLLIPDETTGELVPTPLDALVAPSFQEGGPLDDQTATTAFTLPPQAVVGIRYGVTPSAFVVADYQWTGWSTFDRIVAGFEHGGSVALDLDYEDTHTFRVGGEYAAGPALDLRAGFIYNTAASPAESVTPVLPEAERNLYTVGLAYRFGAFQADLFYNYVRQADRRGRVRSALLLPATPEDLEVGVYSSAAHLFGITMAWVPGGAR